MCNVKQYVIHYASTLHSVGLQYWRTVSEWTQWSSFTIWSWQWNDRKIKHSSHLSPQCKLNLVGSINLSKIPDNLDSSAHVEGTFILFTKSQYLWITQANMHLETHTGPMTQKINCILSHLLPALLCHKLKKNYIPMLVGVTCGREKKAPTRTQNYSLKTPPH